MCTNNVRDERSIILTISAIPIIVALPASAHDKTINIEYMKYKGNDKCSLHPLLVVVVKLVSF